MSDSSTSLLMDIQYRVAVARHKGTIHWLLLDNENLILDFEKRRNEAVSAGYVIPELELIAAQRSDLAIVNQHNAEIFLNSPDVHKISYEFLQNALLERFPKALSWWDVGFLFPVAFIDFDNHRFAGFYYEGPRLERYVPDGWTGEFIDFANNYEENIFPSASKFWIVDGEDLLYSLNERGKMLAAQMKSKN